MRATVRPKKNPPNQHREVQVDVHKMLENPDQIQYFPPDLGLGTPAPAPLVLIHDGGGTTFQYYMLDLLGREMYGVSNPHFESGKKWNSIREMGETYAGFIRSAIPSGKILLGGENLFRLLSISADSFPCSTRVTMWTSSGADMDVDADGGIMNRMVLGRFPLP